jgi:hypothetical protein
MARHLLSLCVLLLLAGCGGWSKTKCSESNFEALGYDRGVRGLTSRGDQINATCLKKKVSIDLNSYNKGYQQGLKAYCTDGKGNENGRLGQKPISVCTGIKQYMTGYNNGLKSYCTVEKGTKDGYALRPKLDVCLSYSQYLLGYKNGLKTFCSNEKGQEDGFSGVEMHATCSAYESYTSGYKKGISNFCMPENGLRLGEKGADFPQKCTKSSFKSAYNKGRGLFIKQRMKDLNTNLDVEKRNYENLRDELQDAQFAFQNLSQSGLTEEQRQQRRELSDRIRRLRKERDNQRSKVTEMETELRTLKSDLESL